MTHSYQYALRSMVHLAKAKKNHPVPVHSIGDQEDIPGQFLAKVMRELGRAELVILTRGRSGGVTLARGSHEITLEDVAQAVNSEVPENQCLLSDDRTCDLHPPCCACPNLRPLRHAFKRTLATTTIEDLARSGELTSALGLGAVHS